MRNKLFLSGTFLFLLLLSACQKDEANRIKDEFYLPLIDPADFTGEVTNPFMPLMPGTKFTYSVDSEEGTGINEIIVTSDSLRILGVKCVVVSDIVKDDNGDVTESTLDWYAEDKDGNVWYFGEDTKEYSNGEVTSTAGSWKAGVDGAQPGIVMPGSPVPGIPYRQEYLFNEAEDMGKVLSFTESVTVPFGTYNNCIMTEEWTPLEPGVVERKYYASGIGNIKTEIVKGGYEVDELTSVMQK